MTTYTIEVDFQEIQPSAIEILTYTIKIDLHEMQPSAIKILLKAIEEVRRLTAASSIEVANKYDRLAKEVEDYLDTV